ncbi:predicted protein [Postia placenta Mad-698-R]|nr:predicted protein [Postia placenta Mad-698-R]
MSFWLFSVCSIFAVTMLMPINLKNNVDIGDGRTDSNNTDWSTTANPTPTNSTGYDWLDLISDANSYLSVHLLFTYIFTLLALYFIQDNYQKFIRARQLYSLELVHSIPARTVMVTHLPEYLRGERALAEYFESMGLSVESVSVCREVGALKRFLDMRTAALLRLESAWTRYVRNPSTVDVQPPLQQQQDRSPLIDVNVDDRDAEASPQVTTVPNRPRPTLRTKWFGRKVDALEYLQQEFEKADEQVKTRRKNGRFRATHSAFVTFENMSSAQMAAQVAYASNPQQCLTSLAPEPRDIVWSNVTHSPMTLRVREWMVMCAMGLLLFFWLVPTSALATLLSFKEIKKIWPQLGELIDANPRVRAIVQNSLPSVAIMSLNAVLPFVLEGLLLTICVGHWRGVSASKITVTTENRDPPGIDLGMAAVWRTVKPMIAR